MRKIALVLVLMCSYAYGQDKEIKIIGETVEVEGYAELTIDAKGTVLWRVVPEPVKKSIIAGGKTFIVAGLPNQLYSIEATVIDWDAKTASQIFKTVSFKQLGPVPNPNPPGPGPAPKPDDPLTISLKAAIARDPDRAIVGGFVSLYESILKNGGIADSAKTYGEFERMMQAEAIKLGLAGKAMVYQTEAATFLRTLIPWKMSSETPADRGIIKDAYSKVKAALDAALRSPNK